MSVKEVIASTSVVAHPQRCEDCGATDTKLAACSRCAFKTVQNTWHCQQKCVEKHNDWHTWFATTDKRQPPRPYISDLPISAEDLLQKKKGATLTSIVAYPKVCDECKATSTKLIACSRCAFEIVRNTNTWYCQQTCLKGHKAWHTWFATTDKRQPPRPYISDLPISKSDLLKKTGQD